MSKPKVKLPKLNPPKFDGDITKWTAFWDIYEATIHNNCELSDIEKFTYLKSYLERNAREAIAGLSLSEANYNEAIEILHRRFGSKERIVARHMEVLLGLEGVSSEHKLIPLRRLYDKVEANVRSLKSLGVEAKAYGSMLCPVLVWKLPPEIRLNEYLVKSGT